jgi:hypothetical protein
MDGLFDTSTSVDPALFGEGNSTDNGAENTDMTTRETAEQPTTNQESVQQAPETETQKLYAGKYKTPEDVEKAYVEVQRALTKATMELSEFKRRNANPVQQQDTSQQPEQNQDYDWYSAYQQDPVQTTYQMVNAMLQQAMQGVDGKINPLLERDQLSANLDEVMNDPECPDFAQYSDKVIEILNKNPDLYKLPNHLKIGYKLARGEDSEAKAKTAFEAGKNAAYQLDQQKQNNIFDNKTTRNEAQRTPEEQIVEGIMKAGGSGWRSFGI